MKFALGFHKVIATDKGVFNGSLFHISTDLIHWIWLHSLAITEHGQLFSSDENDNHFLLLHALQLCHVQIFPSMNSSGQEKVGKRKGSMESPADDPPVIFIKTFENEKLYIKVGLKQTFGNLVLTLVVWQLLKPQGLVKKWYSENKVTRNAATHEVLVCRFKIYGPIPHKLKNLHIVDGPKAPVYQLRKGGAEPVDEPVITHDIHEGWFYTMGVLKLNGLLNFISELDGTLLYSLDVTLVLLSEIREVHNSIFDSSNVLFIGYLKELRFNNVIKTTNNVPIDQYHMQPFLTREGKSVPSNQRILIEFPLHIDLEDWFVGLNYFARREYIGVFSPKSEPPSDSPKQIGAGFGGGAPIFGTPGFSHTSNPTASGYGTGVYATTSNTTQGEDTFAPPQNPHTHTFPRLISLRNIVELKDDTEARLNEFPRKHFKVSKRLSIDIIEAKFENAPKQGKVYAEVRMWGLPWLRTAVVNHTANPFWKEEFSADLPILTQMIHILVKKTSDQSYGPNDKVIGTVYVTPDILATKQSSLVLSTITVGGVSGASAIKVANLVNAGAILPGNAFGAATTPDIVRLPIYDAQNVPIGKLLINVRLKEYHVLPPHHFKTLEQMLVNAPMKDLIWYCNTTVGALEFENVLMIMLDIFQLLGVEDRWFKALMEAELVLVDRATRKNYASSRRAAESKGLAPPAAPALSNVFNTLFRGLSIFSKSLERYNLRIGQEYLEKVFSDWFDKVARQRLNCEVDPRYVRLQERKERRLRMRRSRPSTDAANAAAAVDELDVYGDDLDSELDSDELVASSEEQARLARTAAMLEENYRNLNRYCTEIWDKIYSTSNDLPLQIKLQLKNFRTKVELACDPDDKTTALNCLLAFIFLRFFCPAILNPKLFYLTKNHQTGVTQRTLTLVAKVLLNLANRLKFLPHKEPHLVRMNAFLDEHQDQVYDYFDKITGRKNDFTEKVLDLLHDVKRFDLGLQGDSLSELPTTPYLIDKYLRLTEFIHLLNFKDRALLEVPQSPGNDPVATLALSIVTDDPLGPPRRISELLLLQQLSELRGLGELVVDEEKNVYQIGSLEFEKLEFLDLAGDNETEGFIKLLCRSNENIFSFITLHITLGDLQKQLATLMSRVSNLEVFLENGEFPGNFFPHNLYHQTEPNLLWDAYTNDVLARCYLDSVRNVIVLLDRDIIVPPQYKKLVDQNALALLKLKFTDNTVDPLVDTQGLPASFSNGSLGSVLKTTLKNPLKKWFRKNSVA